MQIKFTIDIDTDADTYRELYSADVTMEDGTSFTVRATEDEVSYDEFRADIFEDLFRSLAEAAGISLTVEEDDYSDIDLGDFEEDIEDYLNGIEPDGC